MTDPRMREQRRLIYELQRKFRQPAFLCRSTSNVVDYGTGRKQTQTIWKAVQAIVLPYKAKRFWQHVNPDVSRKQDFAYGGDFDKRLRTVLLSPRDLDTPIDLNDWMTLGSKRWEVREVEEWDGGEIIQLTIEFLVGSRSEYYVAMSDSVTFSDQVTVIP